MIDGMTALGLDVMTPAAPGEQAGNAAFARADPAAIAKAEMDGIYLWGDKGRIRASAHVFTTEADAEILWRSCRAISPRAPHPSENPARTNCTLP